MSRRFRSLEGLQAMEEPIRGSSQPATGKGQIPEWMLKRRAREARAAELKNAGGSIAASNVAPGAPPQQTARSESQPSVAEDVTSLRQAPAWFNPKKPPASNPLAANSSAQKSETREAATPVIENKPDRESLTWRDALREHWLGKAVLSGYAVSLFTHLLVAVPLSVIVLRSEPKPSEFNSILMEGDGFGNGGGGGEGLDQTSIFQAVPPSGELQANLDSMLSPSNMSSVLSPSALELSSNIGGIGKGGGQGGGEGGGEGAGQGDQIGGGLSIGGYKMPEGGKTVSKGSFTAWTVPTDPMPRQDYKIVIQVKYKKANQKLTKGDVTGSIIGTDNYRLMISPDTSKIFAESNQVVVDVPGGDARVRDTIRVFSAKLRESQRLEIVF